MDIEYVKKIANKIKEHVTGTKLDFPGFIVLMFYWTSFNIYTGRKCVFPVHKKGDPKDVYHFYFTNGGVKVYYDSEFNSAPFDAEYSPANPYRAYELMNMGKSRDSKKHHITMSTTIADEFVADILKVTSKIELGKSIYDHMNSYLPTDSCSIYATSNILNMLEVEHNFVTFENGENIHLQLGGKYLTSAGEIIDHPLDKQPDVISNEIARNLTINKGNEKHITNCDYGISLMTSYILSIYQNNNCEYNWS